MKLWSVIVLGIVCIVMATQFASAAFYLPPVRYAIESVIQGFIDIFEPILTVLLSGNDWTPYLLFERTLIFVLLMTIIWLVLAKVPIFDEQKKIRWVVAILVPLLGVRYLDYTWLETILVQYKVLAIVLTSVLPFIIYFFFLYNVAGENATLRKIGWILYVLVYLGLWGTTYDSGHSEIYFWTMLTALVFLFLDGTIYNYYLDQEIRKAGLGNKYQYLGQLRQQIMDIQRSGMPPAMIDKQVKILEKKIKKIQKSQ